MEPVEREAGGDGDRAPDGRVAVEEIDPEAVRAGHERAGGEPNVRRQPDMCVAHSDAPLSDGGPCFGYFLAPMPAPRYIAHSPPATGGPPQPLFEDDGDVVAHARAVAGLAAAFADAFGSARVAEWLGWWHDAGKVAPDVQAYLRGETDEKRGPDHSSAGMLAAFDALQPLAFNVAGHHGGLADSDALRSRVERKRAEARVTDALEDARPLLSADAPEIGRGDLPPFVAAPHATELWVRMLHSALVDADCLDAEAWREPDRPALRERDGDLRPLWDALDADQQALIAQSDGDVNAARAEVYRACVEAAALPPGVFRLTVPTGGGKTRSAMAFALRHALAHGLRRVIVALPYTSIIEQNADVYRALFREANPAAVLEHHSAVASREEPGREDEAELRDRLAAENWDAPVVVTTTVQLLESLFANRNSRLRKLHRVARSVVILDEVQTLPGRLLAPTLHGLRALVQDYGVTVLLCTATPPAVAQREGFEGIGPVREIVENPAALFRRLKRVEITVAAEPWAWERAAAEARSERQSLAVLNTKKDALALLDALGGADGLFHLSTLLCGAHRRAVLAEVVRRLKADEPCCLVSTQVVEAGVDVDFPLVLRARGPLDRVVQAAGRCNREGRRALGRVVVFTPEEGGVPPGEYRTATDQFDALVRETEGAIDFDDPAAVERYFRLLYGVLDTDARGVQALRQRFLFEQTAAAYRIIEDEAVPVVVGYSGSPDANRQRDAALRRVEHFGEAHRRDWRALQPFVVALRERAHRQAIEKRLCVEVSPGSGVWRWIGTYDNPSPTTGRGLVDDAFFLTDTADGTVI